ncbi:hypothetical protein B566_EDAN006806 [Ephemera danica]|nr:hypothetical protein B566_EDAN006806 [Ephemera danica]
MKERLACHNDCGPFFHLNAARHGKRRLHIRGHCQKAYYPATMLKVWAEEFLATVTRLDPKFIALHCQEVGGKDYELSMKHVDNFVSEELRLFDKVRIYLDEDFSSAEKFTALGNFYFIHKSIANILMWDFKAMQFVAVADKEINSGSIEEVATMEKAKFPQHFFPEKLVEGLTAVRTLSQKCNREECTKVQYQDATSQAVLSVGKKEFSFTSRLFEFDIRFPPSYPFEEDESGARCYMMTRCPAWCDRVVLSHTARELVSQNQDGRPVEYGVIGPNSCMGDHKPVYLMLHLVRGAGRRACCATQRPCSPLLLVCDAATEDAESLSCSTPEPLHQSMHSSPCMPVKFHRAHSSPAVEQPTHALAHTKCRCLSESASWQHQHRLNPACHMLRVNSHHSSSDEEWFERVNATAALVSQSCESKSSDSAVQSSIGSVIPASTIPVMLAASNGKCADEVALAHQATRDYCEAGDMELNLKVAPNAVVASPKLNTNTVVASPKINTDRPAENGTRREQNQKCCTLV